jgi:hypothetical protein
MPTLQLSDVAVGVVKAPSQWDNSQQRNVELDPFEVFSKELAKSDKTVNLQYVDGNILDGMAYHRNYMEYLEKCWAEHLGIVITPDILWYTLLTEMASITKADPEQYRGLFTTSNEKQEIVILQGDPVVMSLAMLVDKLKDYVPTDTSLFLPDFTTSGMRSRHAFRAAFCDMCSPYYNYSMLMCGFPAIDVRGTPEDYSLMSEKWSELGKLFVGHSEWFSRVQTIIDNCLSQFSDADWWRQIFTLKTCGSGGQVAGSGWFTDMFLAKPRVPYPENFPAGVSIVDYKQLNTNKEYRMLDGLFMSRMDGDFLVPNFGFSVFERTKNG